MFPLLNLVEKARKEAARLCAFTGKLIKDWGKRAGDLIPPGIREKLSRFAGKPGFALIGLGLVLCILLGIMVKALVSPGVDPVVEKGGEPGGLSRDAPIPPEELFLPDEPDFLPGIIPEREQRALWTAEDAEPYWYRPLERGEEAWRNRIRATLDEFLEHVP
jgi:hypothetical protein